MADCCTPRKKLCCCVLLFFLVAGITGGAIGIYKWHYSGLNRWHGTGSTANFQKLIQERCDTYTQPIWQGSRNCQAIRQAFMSAFISKDPCKATKEDYKPLMDLAPPTVPCGQHVFWSKTKELAHQYAKKWHLMTLEDTLLGYLADNLSWCGEPGSSDLNIWSCPDWKKDCRTNYFSVFWEVLSERFAESACKRKTARVVLNGSLENAFDSMSTFGRVEASNLRPEVELEAWLVHDTGKPPRDSCSGSSIKKLKSILDGRNVKFTCTDNLSLAEKPFPASGLLMFPCPGPRPSPRSSSSDLLLKVTQV
ncbi:ADP-ribosyl cyclase/cyclic ADP-ribose hydrolase 1 isoform X2 [Bubalus bubalis]|uniref:ADP-ribosyl cyclase/cyclic ADP-ribose hydrolase 1 isoform X2 n=1 Tax=Bubalus bubalis TaxID=89462 RepID=UPI001E1B6B6A|nr:ADP-ribosyl cyclase/cyclic ADP-ribose hydrolase 1 isoform X2 [Bubalus bubalis]